MVDPSLIDYEQSNPIEQWSIEEGGARLSRLFG
jgi:hypothetical protein